MHPVNIGVLTEDILNLSTHGDNMSSANYIKTYYLMIGSSVMFI